MTQFKAGDVVYLTSVSRGAALSLIMIERVTKAQAIDSRGVRYHQSSGRRIPRGEWSTPGISLRTERLDREFVKAFLYQGAQAIRFEADHLFKGDDIMARVAILKTAIAQFETASAWTPEQREKFIANAFDAVRHEA